MNTETENASFRNQMQLWETDVLSGYRTDRGLNSPQRKAGRITSERTVTTLQDAGLAKVVLKLQR